MLILAGNTAINKIIRLHAENARDLLLTNPIPNNISKKPLIYTREVGKGKYLGTILIKGRGAKK